MSPYNSLEDPQLLPGELVVLSSDCHNLEVFDDPRSQSFSAVAFLDRKSVCMVIHVWRLSPGPGSSTWALVTCPNGTVGWAGYWALRRPR